jgi:PAS domain S-box-containing protein
MDTDNHGRAREAHPHSERRFHALAENALDIVMVTGPDGTIRYLSPSVERVLGRTPAEMVGTNSADYVHPDDMGRAFGELEALLSKPGCTPRRWRPAFATRTARGVTSRGWQPTCSTIRRSRVWCSTSAT